jgi:hypothetical protein
MQKRQLGTPFDTTNEYTRALQRSHASKITIFHWIGKWNLNGGLNGRNGREYRTVPQVGVSKKTTTIEHHDNDEFRQVSLVSAKLMCSYHTSTKLVTKITTSEWVKRVKECVRYTPSRHQESFTKIQENWNFLNGLLDDQKIVGFCRIKIRREK